MSAYVAPALQAHLAARYNPGGIGGSVFDLYSFAFLDGTQVYLTSADSDIVYNGNTYLHTGPALQAGSIQMTKGVKVSQTTFQLNATPSTIATLGMSYLAAIQQGLFDGCQVVISRCYDPAPLPNGTLSVDATGFGVVNLFTGEMAQAQGGRLNNQITIKSLLNRLNVQMPRDLIQPDCAWTLYDARCSALASNFQINATVQAGSGVSLINIPNVLIPATAPKGGTTAPSNWLGLGTIQFTGGQNSGLIKTIKQHVAAGLVNYQNTVMLDGPIGLWPLDDAVGSPTVVDVSGNSNNGTVVGGVTLGSTGLLTGDSKTSALFDGSSGYIRLPIPGPYTFAQYSGAFSLECIFTTSQSSPVGIFDSAPGAQKLAVRNDSFIFQNLAYQGMEWSPLSPIVPFSAAPNAIHHMGVVFRGEQYVDIYLDGALYGSAGVSGLGAIDWTNFQIGMATKTVGGGEQFFGGNMMYFGIYPYALAPSQWLAHAAAVVTAPFTVTQSYLTLLSPLPYVPATGDPVLLLAGCDKLLHTCASKFLPSTYKEQYGGADFVPADETGF